MSPSTPNSGEPTLLTMRTIIAGSRHGISYGMVMSAMAACGWKPTEIVSGCAPGADTLGEVWAANRGIPVKRFPALWQDLKATPCLIKHRYDGAAYNALAGHNRNARMAEYADALVAIWDGSSRGTRNMIEQAERLGLKVFVRRIER